MDYFKLKKRKGNIKTEIISGITTFMTMAYIIFVNPAILSQGGQTGIPFESVAIATCLGAGVMSIAMGLITNTPFALASSLGINSVVILTLILGLGLNFQQAMGIIIMEGILAVVLVLTRIRQMMVNAIPGGLKYAMGAGIGLFLAFMGAKQGGFITLTTDNGLAWGDFTAGHTWLAALGLILTLLLVAFKVKGGILLGIAGTAAMGVIFKIIPLPQQVFQVPHPQSFSTFFKVDLAGAVVESGMINIIALTMVFALFMADFFGSLGTVMGVGQKAGLIDGKGNFPGLKKVLLIDSLGTIGGGLLGTGPVTTHAESASGVSEGGRTGIMPAVTGILFLVSIFFMPLIATVGGGVLTSPGIYRYPVTAPALIITGFLMMEAISKIDFKDLEIGIPALLTIIIMPFTSNISYGIGFGFISYTIIKLFKGKFRQLHPLMIITSVLFAAAFTAEKLAQGLTGF